MLTMNVLVGEVAEQFLTLMMFMLPGLEKLQLITLSSLANHYKGTGVETGCSGGGVFGRDCNKI